MTNAAKAEDVEAFLTAEMQRRSASGDLTKKSAARLAIAAAIRNGLLPKGSTISTEKRLTTVMGISLGTVQAALRQLQQSGIVVRRRGDGSRVASTEAFGRETWHFRLLAKDTGVPLRISNTKVEIDFTNSVGPWSETFPDCDAFIRIRRRMTMSGGVAVGAEMILPQALVPGMQDVPPNELRLINIRPFLAEKHGVLITRADHEIETIHVNDLDAKRLNVVSGTLAFQIVARAFLVNDEPGYWQRILAPCEECRVTF